MSLAESLQTAATIQEMRRHLVDGLLDLSRLEQKSCLLDLADQLISEEMMARAHGRLPRAASLLGCTHRRISYRAHKYGLRVFR